MTTLLAIFAATVLTMISVVTLWGLSPTLAFAIACLLAIGLSMLTVVSILHTFEEGEN